jgi:hypothetical protein
MVPTGGRGQDLNRVRGHMRNRTRTSGGQYLGVALFSNPSLATWTGQFTRSNLRSSEIYCD